MGIEFESTIDFPQSVVFEWFSRPGAMPRLIPPWQPMRAVEEATSLADGRAVLGFPGGLRWIAQHEAASYDPPNRFVDVLSSDGIATLPPRVIGKWRHTHEFAHAGHGSTRVIDRVDTPVPAFMLRSTFEYRHRQLVDDLTAHQRAADQGAVPLTVAITGSSGLVGSALAAFLTTGGHRVVRLVRRSPTGPDERMWDPANPATDLFADVDAVVHLAGESIAARFTEAHKRTLRESRIDPTRKLAAVAAKSSSKPVFVTASAIGFYGPDRGDEELTEDSERGGGFLADLVEDWENATAPASDAGLRVVQVRTGIVQTPAGGTLGLLRPLFAAGLGGRLGSGSQWLSWIGLDDLLDVYYRALFDERLRGPVNAVAPQPVRNTEYTKVLAAVLHRPAVLPVPGFGPRLLLGRQGTEELAEADQRVLPRKLAQLGHEFRYAGLEETLRHQLGKSRSSV
ncbi:TIGR01777 family oxidoreductase [Antrihabitans sp. YC3-6]|uniref:TIGR01777 family oxidoreductase n=1 Tax=Antrihabitans stalagmiti TaxID=2799499 RepID=A0A934U2Q0_9NOCA|nr:TIGR01777 family oxidoreductase [Antrihabitans stalagmiti]MBJ8339344.1 TIGR01777 family oxidoreductase [Antrihabitans stalagmiti]